MLSIKPRIMMTIELCLAASAADIWCDELLYYSLWCCARVSGTTAAAAVAGGTETWCAPASSWALLGNG